jgi:hypothetical protein
MKRNELREIVFHDDEDDKVLTLKEIVNGSGVILKVKDREGEQEYKLLYREYHILRKMMKHLLKPGEN